MIHDKIVGKLLAVGCIAALLSLVSCSSSTTSNPPPAPTPSSPYKVVGLTSDQAGAAEHTDPTLINAWGMSVSSGGTWWLSSNVGGVTNVYDSSGDPTKITLN